MRWSLALQPYRYTVHYIKGSQNDLALYLSHCYMLSEVMCGWEVLPSMLALAVFY